MTAGAEPERIDGALVTGDFFELFGARAHRGRLIAASDDKLGGERVVVISHGLWQRVFGGRADIVGQTVTFATTAYRVIGVLDRTFAWSQVSVTIIRALAWSTARAPR